jgi:NADH-quinone oxidoreductase subunit D
VSELIISNEETGDEMTLNMGPHHPSTHGVLRFVVKTDGEIIRKATPDVGFLHRALEKIAERCTYEGYMPYTDRIDYVAAMFPNQAWAMACEKLMAITPPPRAEYLRTISVELQRVSSHLIMLGCMAMDLGAVTAFPWALREREYINDFLEELCGARLTYNYHRIGGVSFDMPKGWRDKVLRWTEAFPPLMDEYDRLVSYNEIYVKRLASVATITAEQAVDWGVVGPNLRASGVKWDLRKEDGYSVYPKLQFDVPVGQGKVGTVGDCWDRWDVRCQECRESAKLVRQCLEQIEEHAPNEIMAELPKRMKPEGEAYARIESARGDMGIYIVAKGGTEPYRVRIRTGSFQSMAIVEPISERLYVADLVALISSTDVVAPEIDR